jgi:hypothetical protein
VKSPKPLTRTIKLAIMAPVTVEMIVEQAEHGWIPTTIIRADYLHTMTPRFINENADEDTLAEIDRLGDEAENK